MSAGRFKDTLCQESAGRVQGTDGEPTHVKNTAKDPACPAIAVPTMSLAVKIRANKSKFGAANRRKSGLLAFRAAAQGVSALMQHVKDNVPEVVDNISVESMPLRIDINNKIHHEAVTTFFSCVDVDGSGEISVPEFINALRVIGDRLGRRFHRKDAMTLFSSLDINGDGVIDAEEMFEGLCRINDRQLLAIC